MKKRKPRRASRTDRIEIGFLEGVHRRVGSQPQVLEALGGLYTQVGRYQEGLHTDIQLSRLQPRTPHVWYNLACSHALLGQADAAFAALELAIRLGYDQADWMLQDEDLHSIRSDPRFTLLVQKITVTASQDLEA